jgi:hypothetical protein
MDNPEKLATLGTHDAGRREKQIPHRTLKRRATRTPSNAGDEPRGTRTANTYSIKYRG